MAMACRFSKRTSYSGLDGGVSPEVRRLEELDDAPVRIYRVDGGDVSIPIIEILVFVVGYMVVMGSVVWCIGEYRDWATRRESRRHWASYKRPTLREDYVPFVLKGKDRKAFLRAERDREEHGERIPTRDNLVEAWPQHKRSIGDKLRKKEEL